MLLRQGVPPAPAPCDRSAERRRQRVGGDKLLALLHGSLATGSGALKPSDLARVVADTTHCAAEVIFPTDATGEDLAGMLVKAMLRITIGLRGTAIA